MLKQLHDSLILAFLGNREGGGPTIAMYGMRIGASLKKHAHCPIFLAFYRFH